MYIILIVNLLLLKKTFTRFSVPLIMLSLPYQLSSQNLALSLLLPDLASDTKKWKRGNLREEFSPLKPWDWNVTSPVCLNYIWWGTDFLHLETRKMFFIEVQ